MEVTNTNNVKIYNLSAGRSLPSWLSQKRKKQAKADINIRNRIELLQDFDMPTVSDCIKVSKDGQYLMATGTYKPRVRCYDVNNLSMKFERCFDSDVVQFEMLADDYSKLVFLHCDRYVEFHAQYGKYYRTRIPKFGRDLAYHKSSCTLYFVGASSEVYRLNLEQGKFVNSLMTGSSSLNVCKVNPVHELFVCGTAEGRVEAWDTRSRNKVGVLDCALSSITDDTEIKSVPSVTSLCFRDGLHMAVGTSTGQVLLYDIRSDKPLLVKDHMYGLPIKNVEFHPSMDMVFSMDSRIVKIWDRNTGKAFTFVEPGKELNDLCLVPNSGMLFLANEDIKMLTYYIPSLGPAPRWCSFLDSLTEELEESMVDTVYDDYKFLTTKELETLGLSHLIGSNLLRAYMHGYFVDMRLYHKAMKIVEPFAFDEYRKRKIRKKLEEEWANRVKLDTLPNVNKELAQKLMVEDESGNKKQQKKAQSLLKDDRFKALFENPDFEVDSRADEYRLINPLVSKLDRSKVAKQHAALLEAGEFEGMDENGEADPNEAEKEEEEESSDDDHTWTDEVKRQYKMIKRRKEMAQREADAAVKLGPKFYALKPGDEVTGVHGMASRKRLKASLEERLKSGESSDRTERQLSASGNRQMTFTFKSSKKEHAAHEAMKEHRQERSKIRREAPRAEQRPRFMPRKTK